MKGKLFGVSVGPGDPEYMTLKAIRTIERCPVIAAPRTDGKCSVALEIARGALSMENKEILFLDFLMSRDETRTGARNGKLAALLAASWSRGWMLLCSTRRRFAVRKLLRDTAAYRGNGYETQTIAGA
jgi:precorrin-2/cobalt-factor-2 C20-methyltransferase